MTTKMENLRKNCGKHHIFCATIAFGEEYAQKTSDTYHPYPKETLQGWFSIWRNQLVAGERPCDGWVHNPRPELVDVIWLGDIADEHHIVCALVGIGETYARQTNAAFDQPFSEDRLQTLFSRRKPQ